MPCCSGRPEFEPYGHSGISQRDVRQFSMSWKDMLRPRQINFSAFVTFFSGIGSDVRLNRHKKRAARSGEIMRNRGRLSDRKSVVEGKSGSGLVNQGGNRMNKQK